MRIKVLLSSLAITILTGIIFLSVPSEKVVAKGGSLISNFLSGGPCVNVSFSDGFPALYQCSGMYGSFSRMSLPLPRVNGLRPYNTFAGIPGAVLFDWDPASMSGNADGLGGISESCSDLPDEGNERLVGTYINTKVELFNPPGGLNQDGRSFNIQKVSGGGEMFWGIQHPDLPAAYPLIDTVQLKKYTSDNIFPGGSWGTDMNGWQGPGGQTVPYRPSFDTVNKYINVHSDPDMVYLFSPTSSVTFGGSSPFHNGEPGIDLRVANEYYLYARKGVQEYDTCNKYCKHESCSDKTDPITGESHHECHCTEYAVRWEAAGGPQGEWTIVGSGLTVRTRYFSANTDPIIPIFQSQPLLVAP